MNKYAEELMIKLEKANDILKDNNLFVEIVVVGGAAFILKELVPRATHDIDSLQFVDERVGILLENVFDINSRVAIFEQNFGYWDEDVIMYKHYSNLKVNTISDERLIVSRIFSGRREEDAIVASRAIKMEIDRFEKLMIEIYECSDPVLLRGFRENENLVEEIYKIQGWNYEESDIKNLYKK